jgi:cobyric acid synthase
MPHKHHTRALMVQGTSSSVGKSVIAAALCRILAQNGVKVAPFKAQNMSNNSYVTADGGEMGRAQVVQAQAAGVEPHTDMNPVLLKPEADSRSQVVINGKAVGSFEARKYWGDQTEVWTAVTEAYDRLASQYDVIVLEGAGSPAEVNLRDRDIVNMRMAAYAKASVILVGDIDRGGVFASLLGTMELLLPDERKLVKATLINRFRGDLALLDPLPELIAERTGVPVLGVVPFVYDLQVKDEDGVTFGDYDPPALATRVPSEVIEAEGSGEGTRDAGSYMPSPGPGELEGEIATSDQVVRRRPEQNADPANTPTQPLTIAVIALPRVSNHDDLDPFRRAGCRIRVVTNPAELATAHIIIIPGSKSTIADLRWMKSRGLDQAIIEAANRNVTVVGICGGYQILGQQLDDPDATESPEPQSEPGLGLLPTSTIFDTQKTTRRVNIEIPAHDSGPLKGPTATGIGYEIHTGITTGGAESANLAQLTDDHASTPDFPSEVIEAEGSGEGTRDTRASHTSDTRSSQSSPGPGELEGETATRDQVVRRPPEPNETQDGVVAGVLPIIGTYVHGLFDSPEILRRLLNSTAETHNLPEPLVTEFSMEAEYGRLAQAVRESIDMNLINSLIT